MKIKAKIIQTDIYEKEMIFEIDIDPISDREHNERQASEKVMNQFAAFDQTNLSEMKDTFVNGTTDVEIIAWDVKDDPDNQP